MHQLLWIEILIKASSGAALVLFPLTTIRLLGLPRSADGFWPRVLGAVLLGIAAALFIEGAWEGSRGLGLAGVILINISGAAVLALAALFGDPPRTRRGPLVLWSIVVLLLVLVLVEIAQA